MTVKDILKTILMMNQLTNQENVMIRKIKNWFMSRANRIEHLEYTLARIELEVWAMKQTMVKLDEFTLSEEVLTLTGKVNYHIGHAMDDLAWLIPKDSPAAEHAREHWGTFNNPIRTDYPAPWHTEKQKPRPIPY